MTQVGRILQAIQTELKNHNTEVTIFTDEEAFIAHLISGGYSRAEAGNINGLKYVDPQTKKTIIVLKSGQLYQKCIVIPGMSLQSGTEFLFWHKRAS